MKYSFKWYFLRFLRGPANVATGLVQTVTLGFYEPNFALYADCAFLNQNDLEVK